MSGFFFRNKYLESIPCDARRKDIIVNLDETLLVWATDIITLSRILSVRVDLFEARRFEFLATLTARAWQGSSTPVISVLEESVRDTTLVISEPH